MIFYRADAVVRRLNYMIKLKGTLLLQMLPAMVLSGGLAGALSAVYDMDDGDERLWADLFHRPQRARCSASPSADVHPPPEHLVQPVREGVSQVKVMYSKMDGRRLQILAFDCCEHGVETRRRTLDAVCDRGQLFEAMSALAVMKLHATDFCDSIEAEVEAENHEFEMMFPTDGRATASRRAPARR